MYDRETSFRERFSFAAKHLGTTPEQVVSLKVRENVPGHEYQELLHALEHEAGVSSGRIDQCASHLLEHSKTKIIVVEHETGLEILYIAGSVASLISLIPLVLRCWSWVRDPHSRAQRPPEFRSVETRRLGSDGHLIEERSNGLAVPWAEPLSVMNTAMLTAAENIDAEIQQIKQTVGVLTKRLVALEKRAHPTTKQSRPRKKTK